MQTRHQVLLCAALSIAAASLVSVETPRGASAKFYSDDPLAVSYTHLTLPTILRV